MAGVYDDDITTAIELIQEFGVQCTWNKGTVTPDDSTQPWLGGEEQPNDYEPFICFVPATETAIRGFGLYKMRKDGEDVPQFSELGLMAPQAFTPELTDKLVCLGTSRVMVDVQTIAPAGFPVLHVISIV